MKTKTTAILLVLFSTLLTSIGQLFYKLGADQLPKLFINYFLIIGLLTYFIALVIFIIALKYEELSILYPIYATSYIWVTLMSFFILREPSAISKYIGITLIVMGVAVVGKS